ncbi:TPA: hypothetical protein TUL06_002149 [Streptococcus equi subsp. zooepidemicus]|uniref:hypothetical protein n=1 Tax=Streptococcus equi TaxID=1336 RepID=UPI000F6DAD06|nr:hypothetical protein [Streptococcus equi]VED85580.1 Uncharacterised protein [Streptococcus equi subsp. equi]MCD3400952.1 hypothetical protein [Streptococcus equi subsp. zooepidemicus]MCD3413489.1 hypothetical protein [Streptococcus equi subsp. zooepidemicus]MCD3430965.1 hypothetical protein [Streptococcus equi subsp. zooepidemicus]QGM23536.1 hypothetical protein GJS33_05095 [Streptococcus equi subsp. zooepidemicus]
MWVEPEDFAWTYAKTNDFDWFKKRLMHWIESRDYDGIPENTKKVLKEVRQSFINQRQNGHRKAELQSEYWDKVIDYLAVAYYEERPGHLFTTSVTALNRPIDEFSKDIQRIIWRFAETEDVEGAIKCLVGFVRPYLNEIHLFKLEPVFTDASEKLTKQRSQQIHKEDMDNEYWKIMIYNLDNVFVRLENYKSKTVYFNYLIQAELEKHK